MRRLYDCVARITHTLSVQAYNFRNSKRSELLLGEFFLRAFRLYVSGVKLDFLAYLILAGGAPLIVSVFFIAGLH